MVHVCHLLVCIWQGKDQQLVLFLDEIITDLVAPIQLKTSNTSMFQGMFKLKIKGLYAMKHLGGNRPAFINFGKIVIFNTQISKFNTYMWSPFFCCRI